LQKCCFQVVIDDLDLKFTSSSDFGFGPLEATSDRISNIKPLSSLTKMINLQLQDIAIASPICPIQPVSICQF
jgi:hypothetical protein